MILCLLLVLALPGSRFPVPGGGQPELLDRTLALVGGQPITLSDARAAMAFGLLGDAAVTVPEAVTRLIDRELIHREVQRYGATPPEPSVVEERLAAIRKPFPDAAAFTKALDAHGFTELRLRTWVRDDLRAAGYLAQRFESASVATDEDVRRAYAQTRAEFDTLGRTYEQAEPVIRERLMVLRRQELIADWVQDLRRRTEVVLLPQ